MLKQIEYSNYREGVKKKNWLISPKRDIEILAMQAHTSRTDSSALQIIVNFGIGEGKFSCASRSC
jgi:hypothetical protein